MHVAAASGHACTWWRPPRPPDCRFAGDDWGQGPPAARAPTPAHQQLYASGGYGVPAAQQGPYGGEGGPPPAGNDVLCPTCGAACLTRTSNTAKNPNRCDPRRHPAACGTPGSV